MAIHTSPVLLVAVFIVALICKVDASQELFEEPCNTTCVLRLQNPQEAKDHFTRIYRNQIWVVFLQFIDATSASNVTLEGLENVVLAQKHSTPLLHLNYNCEVYSLTMLSDSLSTMKIPIYWESGACTVNLTQHCFRRSVAGALLRNVTDKRGAVCFGTRIGGGNLKASCCEWRKDTGLECKIIAVNDSQ